MSIRNVFPTVRPSLNLNFARSKTLDPRITFSRTSVGTYLDSDGLIKTAAADTPRFDHKYENGNIVSLGLLVEDQRKNQVTYSEDFTQWNNTNTTDAVDTSITAPDGTNTATKITDDSTNAAHNVKFNFTTDSSDTFTVSCFVKKGDFSYFIMILRMVANSQDVYAKFDFDNPSNNTIYGGGTNRSQTVTEYPNGWYRISLTSTFGAAVTSVIPHIHLTASGGGIGYSGSGNFNYIWGAQLESGSFSTSYIPTSGSTKTRSPDNVTITGTNFTDFYNQSEGTLYASASILGKNIHTTGTEYPNGICKISDTGSNLAYSRVLYFGGQADPDRITFGNRDATVGSISLRDDTFGDIQLNQYYKVCGAYITNDEQAMCLNGRDIKFNGTNVNPPTPNQFLIGTGYHGAIGNAPGGDEMYLNGHISELRYYPKRLSNDQLQNLTK